MKRILLYASFIWMAVALCGCEGSSSEGPDNSGEIPSTGLLTLYSNKPIIRANGTEQALFTAILTDTQGKHHDVTAQTEIYLDGSSTPLAQPAFSSSEMGRYQFYAVSGFNVSKSIEVEAVEGILELAADPAPTSYDFEHRMLLIQHTGTDCPNCPRMMNLLKALSEDEAYKDCYYHVASHSYLSGYTTDDPAYNPAATLLSRTFNPQGYYPWLSFNLTEDYALELSDIQAGIEERHKEVAEGGVAASASLIGERLYINTEAKVSKAGSYRLAAWLLEDNLAGVQLGATASWHNFHNNCLREMAGGSTTDRIYGAMVPDAAAGDCIELITALNVDPAWKMENCKVMVILSAKNTEGDYELVNTALCPVGECVTYRYN